MSERLTKEWTETLVEAFGPNGERGERGEMFVKLVMESWGWQVRHHKENYQKQLSGQDLEFKSPNWHNWYSADVKHNLDDYGSFYVDTNDTGWLFNKSKVSHRIWHCNEDTGWMAWYDREKMKDYIVENSLRNTGSLKIEVKIKLDFITRKKYETTKVYMGNLSA